MREDRTILDPAVKYAEELKQRSEKDSEHEQEKLDKRPEQNQKQKTDKSVEPIEDKRPKVSYEDLMANDKPLQ